MLDKPANNEISNYSVSVWEGILIAIGAIALTGVGLAGLGFKVLNNAFDPTRAEAIAHSLIDYRIPGGSRGVFGINIGSAKFAWVHSTTTPPDVILFVGRTPINKDVEANRRDLMQDFETPPTDDANQVFTETTSRVEDRKLCDSPVQVTISEGQQSFGSSLSSLPAVRYTVSLTQENVEQLVIVTANGSQAAEKAETVFQSLQCR
jgi:hypothetical protein